MEKIKCKKRVHKGYKEFEKIRRLEIKGLKPIRQFFGKYQYFFSYKKKKISLIELIDYFSDGKNLWEIYCLKGKLFEDVERFDTKKEAVKRIRELLR